jgi:DNA-binding IclR family transcriptional regulator
LRAVSGGSLKISDVVEAMRVDENRAEKLIASLVDEGLLQRTGDTVTLP